MSNRQSILFFLFAFCFVSLFFILVLFINSGPIDNIKYDWGDTFTMEQKHSRDELWRTSSTEAIQKGKQLYEINAIGDVSIFLNQIKQGKYGSSEVEIYKVLTNGAPDPRFHSLEYLPSAVRWNLTHYIRSQMPNPKQASSFEWRSLDEEGI